MERRGVSEGCLSKLPHDTDPAMGACYGSPPIWVVAQSLIAVPLVWFLATRWRIVAV